MQRRRPKWRIFHLLTVVIALLALTGQAIAAVGSVRSCQMQMAELASNAESPEAMPGDCCLESTDGNMTCDMGDQDHLPGQGDSCSACKAGYNCKSPQSYEPSTHLMLPAAASAPDAISTRLFSPPLSRSPEGLWRPPARI